MTKIAKKSIKTHQSWSERLMSWGLSKPTIAGIFIAIMGWIEKAKADWAQEYVPFNRLDPVIEIFQHTREIILIATLFLMTISLVLALFKKLSWFCFFSLFSWLIFSALLGLAIDYVCCVGIKLEDIIKAMLMVALIFSPVILFPILFSLIQYKFKKIDKKLLKHRLWIWGICGLLSIGLYIGTACLLFFFSKY